jgi:hypothetical protein
VQLEAVEMGMIVGPAGNCVPVVSVCVTGVSL